jgi:hypothetical protein
MATLALSVAGQFVGGLVGGPIGATVGRALGAIAGSAIDGALFGEKKRPTAAHDIRLQGSSEGGALPRLYGWSRVSGNIIWARELELLSSEGGGAKGFGQPDAEREEVIGASFAVAFCEGEVHRLGRIWADGQLLDTRGLNLRFYRGTEDQLPDGLIEATQGVAPAYRGLCYLVVEQLPLNRFGNRIPHLSVELCRVVGELERDLRAITIIPGATEFGYDPSPRLRVTGFAQSVGENSHVAGGLSDWTMSIDELTALCPNLKHVALVVAWFGDDLRCGHCTISPRVEAAERNVTGGAWSVAGLGRADVPVVSQHGGGPAYGGTPSDSTVLAAIADLRGRGLSVTLYPLIMMDVPADNSLPNPYGGTGQSPYPWRGRITCYPGPDEEDTSNGTSDVASQIAAIVPSYRQMILHYADIAAASGAEALVIGSEMVGLTSLRDEANNYPFVDALVELADDARAIVGAGTKLTYAADWSEYSGVQGGGEKFFHLDPLWASANIDAVGIDNYMPLADWRVGDAHADATQSTDGYDLDYLAANIAGGEGFDWYYASEADRRAQIRSPIGDGTHGEPWIWRYKDLRNWWSQEHFDRPGGVRSATPTAWVPGGKPIWFTELGCAAVDKGANQPNIFGDPKSAESGRPYFSRGTPDPLIQREALRAQQSYWRDAANNADGMVDADRIYLWTWDARPYPAFPSLNEVWADGINHRTGHWLTGRLGGLASDELAQVIAAEHGVTLTAEPAAPFVTGLVLDNVMTAREALEPLMAATGLRLSNRAGALHLGAPRRTDATVLNRETLAAGDEPVISRRRGDSGEAPGRLALTYVDRERDYLSGTVTALTQADGPLAGEATALSLDGSGARLAAERMLDSQSAERETLDFALPPNALTLEPGDIVEIGGEAEGPFEIVEIRDGVMRRVTAKSLPGAAAVATDIDRPMVAGVTPDFGAVPEVIFAQLPPVPSDPLRSRLVVAAYAQPWPGPLQIVDDATGAEVLRVNRRGAIGRLEADLAIGAVGIWDRGNTIDLMLVGAHAASVDEAAALAGSNRIAVETDTGDWEIIGFAQGELIAPGRYRLSDLLRGQDGTMSAVGAASEGARVMVLDARAVSLPIETQWLGETRSLRVYAGAHDLIGTEYELETSVSPALPLRPVHLRAKHMPTGAIAITWTRCSRSDGDGWGVAEAPLDHAPENYRLTIFDGEEPVRSLDLSAPRYLYSTDDQETDFGTVPNSFSFSVAQLSAVLGAGHEALGAYDG